MDNRLKLIASLAKGYKKIIDVGTDHGYLPVYLIKNKFVESAIVSDISKDSLDKAVRLIKENSLNNKIEYRVGNGLDIINSNDKINLIIIAGMGGKLISEIIDFKKNFICENKIDLILQPMQNYDALREYLIKNDFLIKSYLVKEDKIYQVIKVSGFGKNEKYTKEEIYFGKLDDYKYDEIQYSLIKDLVVKEKEKMFNIISKVDSSNAFDKDFIIKNKKEKLEGIEKYLEI